MLKATDQKPRKIIKRWHDSASHWHPGDVMVGNRESFLMIFCGFDLSRRRQHYG